MKNIIYLLFICCCNGTVAAQNPFIKFIEDDDIAWAAYARDSFHFTQKNLSALLREKVNSGRPRLAIIEGEGLDAIINFTTKDAVTQRLRLSGMEGSNILFDSSIFPEEVNNAVELEAVLYIKNGLLQVHIAWASPLYLITTSSGIVLGKALAFSTAFSHNGNIKRRHRRRAIPLGTTTKTITLDSNFFSLKQLYGRGLLQALAAAEPAKHYGFWDVQKDMPLQTISNNLFYPPVKVPVYDADGHLSNTTNEAAEGLQNAGPFTRMVLEQNWFYAPKQNKLFCQITGITLYAPAYGSGKSSGNLTPLLKLIPKK